MENRLKDIINKNRERFDEVEAPQDLWNKIAKNLDKEENKQGVSPKIKHLNKFFFYKIAAGFILFIAFSFFIYDYGVKQGQENYALINPDLAAQKENYTDSIYKQKELLVEFSKNNPELESEFLETLTEIENNYEELKSRFSKSPDKERTLKAMIINLEIQHEVLNQQLLILSQLNTKNYETL